MRRPGVNARPHVRFRLRTLADKHYATRMFVVKNRLPVARGREGDFEAKFADRARRVESATGFVRLEILRPIPRRKDPASGRWAQDDPDVLHYEVRSYWQSMQAFDAWTESDAFSSAHERVLNKQGRADAGKLEHGLLSGRPEIQFHEVLEASKQQG